MSSSSPISVFGTQFQNPILLAAGTAGFGREVAGVMYLDRLGGIVTKSVSPEPRAGHPGPRVAEFDAGMLNAVGLANPGVDRVAAVELPWLASHLKKAHVLVSVVGSVAEDYVRVVRKLAAEPKVTGFELNVSCPNTERRGEEFEANESVLADLVARCKAVSDKPLVVKLGPTVPDVGRAARAAATAGADGISVVNTLPGALWRREGSRCVPRLGFGQGGVSGPALLPVGLLAVRRVKDSVALPVIGVGGIRSPEDVEQYLYAGATLVAVGTAALAHPRVPERLVRWWEGRG